MGLSDMCGKDVRKAVASVKRALDNPVSIGYGLPKTYAAVMGDEVCISTDNDGYNVTWFDEDEHSEDFENQKEAIQKFLLEVKCSLQRRSQKCAD